MAETDLLLKRSVEKDGGITVKPKGGNGTFAHKTEEIYTVEEAVERLGFGPFQLLIAFFCGMIWLAEAMELMLLSVLSPALQCDWQLSDDEEALITSVVFVGFLLGGLFWGIVCDKIGRKTGLFIIDVLVLIFGVLSAVPVSKEDTKVPGYGWLLFCRAGVGFASAGAGQTITYFAEFLPRRARGICITFVEVWWAIGSMFGAALALAVMRPGGLGWHWYLGLAAVPLALVLVLFPLVPESARYLAVKGKYSKAQNVIKRIAWMNFREPLPGRLVTEEEKQRCTATLDVKDNSFISNGTPAYDSNAEFVESSFSKNGDSDKACLLHGGSKQDGGIVIESQIRTKGVKTVNIRETIAENFRTATLLFTNGMWKTTPLLLLIWFVSAWLYYGIVLLTTTLLQHDPHCGVVENFTNESCTYLDEGDYVKILWTAAAELPGIVVTILIIEIIGRKLTMAIEFLITTAGFLLLFVCGGQLLTTLFLFLVRAFASGVFQAAYVYTPEVYPTKIRGVGLGLCSSAARIGAILTPYAAQVLLRRNEYATIGLYAGSALMVTVASLLLPIETKGRSMRDEGGNKS